MMTPPKADELVKASSWKRYREVWFWSLFPIATMLLLVIVWWISAAAEMKGLDAVFWIMFFLQGLVFIVSWIGFGLAVAKYCMKNWAVVLLSLIYPVLQGAVQFAILFGGCLKVMDETDFRLHGPPQGYEDTRQLDDVVPKTDSEPEAE